MTSEERLSSSTTFFTKVFPVSVMIIIVILTPFTPLLGHMTHVEVIGALSFECSVLVVMYLLAGRLKEVTVKGDVLIVSNYLKEIRIPLASIESVSQLIGGNGMVTIQLKSNSEFGSEITFIPKWRLLAVFSTPPGVIRLNRMLQSRDQRNSSGRKPISA